MNNTLIDNSRDFLLIDILKKCINDETIKTIQIATGYWDLPGTKLILGELSSFFARGGKLQLLIGQEPMLRSYQVRNDATQEEVFPDFYIKRDIDILTDEYKPVAELLLDNINEDSEDESNIQIHVYGQGKKKKFLHAKCYIFNGDHAVGIIGSSNFTEKGLKDNAELNYLETNTMSVRGKDDTFKSHVTWFEEMWENSEPWTGKFIKEILKPSPIGVQTIKERQGKLSEPLTPYELYIKLLQTKFGDIIDRNLSGELESYLPDDYMALEYQIQAARQCLSIMREHHGFMLADVVGLGKTIVGVLVAKHFLSLPEDDGLERKVLIITPPAIQGAWKETIADFERDREDSFSDKIDFITTGSIGKLVDDEYDSADDDMIDEFNGVFKDENYGLILIDESHKFKSDSTAMYKALNDLIDKIGSTVGTYPYIGLLSATPQNNDPYDIRNQIYLFERNHRESTLKKADGGNLESYFAQKHREYDEIIHFNDEEELQLPIDIQKQRRKLRHQQLIKLSEDIREHVLSDILVRRTRTDVKKYFEKDMEAQQLHFPDIASPEPLVYKMQNKVATLFAESSRIISQKIDEASDEDCIMYYRYRAIEYLKDEGTKKLYEGKNMGAKRFSKQLARIMQINLVKRLESSFTAFKASLENLCQYTQNMINMLENDTVFICPDIDVNFELRLDKKVTKENKKLQTFAQCVEDIRKKIQKLDEEGRNEKGRNREFKKADFSPEYIDLLRVDLELIKSLCSRWNKIVSDPKIEVFRRDLKPVLLNPQHNVAQKLVIFTEAVDTQKALVEVIEDLGLRVLEISSKNRKDYELRIKENFDANYRGEWKNDYDVIVTTDVLAEGINLHRANVILNYDTPWNSTKLMQRIGRVNRVGSKAKCVYIYNFMPSAQGDNEIQLVQKAHTKLQSFHTLFGEDSQIFSQDEEVTHYDLKKIIDGEESPMQKYIYELREYKDNNPVRYNFIHNCTDNLHQAVSDSEGNAYMLVRTPRFSGMFVKVGPEGKAGLIATTDILEAFRVPVETEKTILPQNWEEICRTAEKKVNQELVKITTTAKNSKKATDAKAVIEELNTRPEVESNVESLKLLGTARSLIGKGNLDIIRHVLNLQKYLKNQEGGLFDVTAEDINTIIRNELERILNVAEQKQGKASTFIALAK